MFELVENVAQTAEIKVIGVGGGFLGDGVLCKGIHTQWVWSGAGWDPNVKGDLCEPQLARNLGL